ncbi:DUF6328 family protein [Streptomyces sp. NPDC048330]|uniref:DUF6328 family protein n=1 Tax=Streptomyces sp. NPDC048330 TaxID=3365533 RepID=UPI00371F4ED1
MTATRRQREEGTARRPRVSCPPEGDWERANRRWQEVLQGTRVARTGVRILFGFLLSLAFTFGFRELGGFDHGLYVVTVVLAASSTAALIAPVSLHRCLRGMRLKEEVVIAAGRLMVCGMVLLTLTIAYTLMLIFNVVLGSAAAAGMVVGGAMLLFALSCLRGRAPARSQEGGSR